MKTPPLHEPIAIVGMSCRFPQVNTLSEFWELLSQGRDTVEEMSNERWNVADYYDPDPTASRKTNQRHGSFLKNIHDFDPLFFAISPAEAVEMNPSQKLMLELVWEAIENSTIPYNDVQGRKIGVYVGNIWSDFEHLRKHKNATVTSHSAVGQSSNIIANRVSFAYGFSGPSLVIDTGCSSSLVALHLACQSLWDNSTEMSFVGGINHILDPDQYVLLSKFGGLSSNGKCSTFDIDADGFVRGEGAGVLMLKRLSDAERDGDKIFALVRGSAMNNNGYNVNLPATSVNGQKQVLADAYASSGIAPAEVHYVEAHGTGTKLGDPTETRALGEFFGNGRNDSKLHVGSVKTNIGHLEAAAGIAGLIKVVLAMQHRQLPPSLNYKTPNPNIAFDELKLQVQHQLGAWPTKNGETLKAGINSFGWGGTNAHTVLEEYRPVRSSEGDHPDVTRYCLPLSAKSPAALKEYAKAYLNLFKQSDEEGFKNICVAAAIRKPGLDHRHLFSATSKEDMIQSLEEFLETGDDSILPKSLTAKDKFVLIFPGQGSQWLGMGRDLYASEPVFKKVIDECDEVFAKYTDWSLIGQLHADEAGSRLNEINVIQPALFAMQIAIAELWIAWGLKPSAVVGHSMGEVAAAYIGGALSLDDAARIICTRSKLMKTVAGKGGAMAVTELSLSDAEELVKRYPELSVAVNNSPKSTVLAGDQQEINKVLAELEGKGLFCRPVKVDVASHSKQMEPLKSDLFETLKSVKPREAIYPIFSTVYARPMEGSELKAAYWVNNLRGTVQFASAIEQLLESGHTAFIEVSSHPVLINAVSECIEHAKASALTVASVYRDKPEQVSIYKNLAELYSRGYEIDWKEFYNTTLSAHVELPAYPFQRERYELEDRSHELSNRKSTGKYSLLGTSIPLAGDEEVYFWETQIGLSSFPYFRDHQVNETPVLPGAAYAEMVIEASRELFDHGIPVINHLKFVRSVTLSAEEVSTIQLKITRAEETYFFSFYAKTAEGTAKKAWELLAEGELKLMPKKLMVNERMHVADSFSVELPANDYYESLKTLGLQYGPAFQGLQQLKKSITLPDDIHFEVKADDLVIRSADAYEVHPAFLDACFQPLFYAIFTEDGKKESRTTFLTEIEELQLLNKIDFTQNVKGVARLHPLKKDEQRGFINVEADVQLYQSDGLPLVNVRGLKGKIIDTTLVENQKEKLKNWLYKVSWVKAGDDSKNQVAPVEGTWVVMADPYGLGEVIADKVRSAYGECILVSPGSVFSKQSHDRYTINYGNENDYATLMGELFNGERNVAGILHAASMSYTWQDPDLTADIVEEHQVYGSVSFMYLHQQLVAQKLTVLPKLVIVTNGIHTVGHEHDFAQPVHSPLWGIVKVMFNELTQYHSRYFDLSANPSVEELDQIVEELKVTETSENEIALRGTVRFVPRLGIYHEEHFDKPKKRELSPLATYLITGFKGLGFVFIEWMVKQGARNFALLSRTGEASQEVQTRMQELERQGCAFRIFKADAGKYQEIKAVLEEIDTTMPPLRGIVHAAGVIEAKTLSDLDHQEFLHILNPKVKGAWNLHLLTQQREMDCFIMFSSASTLIGLSGQGSYVAANAFLDTLAHTRRRMGLPGMSINWGVIKDVGMVANEAELEKYAKAEGFEPVSMHEAMEVFNAIYDSEHTQIGIVKLHAETMAGYYSALAKTSYFKGLLVKEDEAEKQKGDFLQELLSMEAMNDRIAALEGLVTLHVSKIAKTPASRITRVMTFKGLGIDSLMAIQLRNLLEKSLDLKLSVAMFWNHPSIGEYSEYLGNLLAEKLLVTSFENNIVRNETCEDSNKWMVIPRPNPTATFRLFCFHDAGGNTSLFHSWESKLGDEIEMVTIELPGRGRRMNEPTYGNLNDLVRDIVPVLTPMMDKPFVFFGHSMGGLIAFEVTRELRRRNLSLPSRLFISSTPGLTTYTKREVDHTVSDYELVEMFPHLSEENIKDSELRQLLLNLLRADLQLIGSYEYTAQTPLDLPLVVIHGDQDSRVSLAQAEKWMDETAVSCKVITRHGGHRYIDGDGDFLTSLIEEEVYGAMVPVSNTSVEKAVEPDHGS